MSMLHKRICHHLSQTLEDFVILTTAHSDSPEKIPLETTMTSFCLNDTEMEKVPVKVMNIGMETAAPPLVVSSASSPMLEKLLASVTSVTKITLETLQNQQNVIHQKAKVLDQVYDSLIEEQDASKTSKLNNSLKRTASEADMSDDPPSPKV